MPPLALAVSFPGVVTLTAWLPWVEFDKCGAVIGAQLCGGGTDAADFLRLRLWADHCESVRKMVLALVYGFLHPPLCHQ